MCLPGTFHFKFTAKVAAPSCCFRCSVVHVVMITITLLQNFNYQKEQYNIAEKILIDYTLPVAASAAGNRHKSWPGEMVGLVNMSNLQAACLNNTAFYLIIASPTARSIITQNFP